MNNRNEFKIIIDDSFEDLRIDKLLAISPFMGGSEANASDEGSANGLSRSFIKKLIHILYTCRLHTIVISEMFW